MTYAQVYMQKSSGTTGNISPAGDYGIGLRYQDIVITIFAGDLKHSISLYDGSGTLIKHETENDSINVTLDQGKYQFFVIMETGTWKRKSDGNLQKYLRGKEQDVKTLRKAYAHLISKGFDHDTARAALEEMRGAWEEEE